MQKFGFSVSKRLIGVYDLNATVNLWVSEKKTPKIDIYGL